MDALLEQLRRNVLTWTTSAAATLAGLQFITPSLVDFMIDVLTVGLVFIAAKLAQQKEPGGR